MPIANVTAGQFIDPTTFGNAVVDAINDGPRGRLGSATTTTTVNSTTAESADIFTAFNITLDSTRWVKVTLFLDSVSSTVANDVTNIRLYVGGTIRSNCSVYFYTGNANFPVHLTWLGQLAAGTYAVTARHVRAAGTGTCSAGGQASPREARLIAEDLGA